MIVDRNNSTLSVGQRSGTVLTMFRPGLAMYDEITDDSRHMVRVVLAVGEQEVAGSAELRDEIDRPFALAEATLAAAASHAGLKQGFRLVESRVVELVTGDVAIVTCMSGANQNELLAGVAPLRGDGWEKAICRASLDAVNRLITKD